MVVASFIARVLHVSPATVIRELKKSPQLESIKSAAVADNTTRTCEEIRLVEEASVGIEESELDEMWSYVGQPAMVGIRHDRLTGQVSAYTFGSAKR